jgi:rhodanese-related sulfurtransferase
VAEARVDQLLTDARTRIDRIPPEALADELAGGALLVDIRPEANRLQDGEVPGAVVVELVHLLWRLDATSPHRLPQVTADSRIIVMCNDGYASSLAAAQLLELGHERSADLDGGARGWFRHTTAAGRGPTGK